MIAAWQVAPAMPSVAREESGWMELLQFVTPSSAVADPPQKAELDPTHLIAFLEACRVGFMTHSSAVACSACVGADW